MVIFACTSTFAWLKLNPNAWFDDMEMEISTNDDLKVSIDGTIYKNRLTKQDIKTAIVAKFKNYTIKYDGTKKQDVFIDKNEEEVSISTVDSVYRDIKLVPTTSIDGETFYNRYGNTQYNLSQGFYVAFDIYFQSVTQNTQSVYFANQTSIDEDGNIIPPTTLGITDKPTADANLWTNTKWSFDTYLTKDTNFLSGASLRAGDKISYSNFDKTFYYGEENIGLLDENSEQVFGVYASDAVRFSVSTTVNGTVKKKGIYEINEGRGSYATDLSSEYYSTTVNGDAASYDANLNTAFTYYNTAKRAEAEAGAINDGTIEAMAFENMPETFKGLDTEEASKILELNADNNYGANGKAKMTITLWLEGWDADCVDMVLDQVLSLDMSFTNYKSQKENKTIQLKYVDVDLDDVPSGEYTEADVVKTRTQMQGLQISDLTPLKRNGKKFVGWKYKNYNGEYAYWSKDIQLKPGSNVPIDADETGVVFYADYE